MDKLDKQELYKQMQALYVEENDLRVGDKVEITRPHGIDELGSDSYSHYEPEIKRSGGVGQISDINKRNIIIILPGDYTWVVPFHVLEIIDQPRDPEVICKFFVKNKEGKLVEYEMSPDSARNYHKAMGEK